MNDSMTRDGERDSDRQSAPALRTAYAEGWKAAWKEAAKQAQRGAFVWRDMNNGKADALHEFADYCRQQAREEG